MGAERFKRRGIEILAVAVALSLGLVTFATAAASPPIGKYSCSGSVDSSGKISIQAKKRYRWVHLDTSMIYTPPTGSGKFETKGGGRLVFKSGPLGREPGSIHDAYHDAYRGKWTRDDGTVVLLLLQKTAGVTGFQCD